MNISRCKDPSVRWAIPVAVGLRSAAVQNTRTCAKTRCRRFPEPCRWVHTKELKKHAKKIRLLVRKLELHHVLSLLEK